MRPEAVIVFMREFVFSVPGEYAGRPIIGFLRGGLGFSTRIVQTLRHTPGAVLLNGTPARVIDKLQAGDELRVLLPDNSSPPLLWDAPLDIVYEDDDLLVINKPAGLSVHPTRNHPNGTLANAVAAHIIKGGGEPSAARAVGRLDKGTSGLILFAKNIYAASLLNGKIEKIYIALASAHLPESGTVDVPIYRPDPLKTLRAAGETGDSALTHYRVISYHGDYSLCEVKIETGRTHQIRVHMQYLGAPLVGDDMYGGPLTDCLKRPALHCRSIKFMHPAQNRLMTFCADMPADIADEINGGR